MKIKYLIAVASFSLFGCVNVQSGKDFDATKASSFQKGKSTRSDVISAIGVPDNSGGNADGSFIEYRYSVVKSGGSPLAAYGIGSSSVEDKLKQCRFNFDHADKLKDYTCSEGMPDYSGFGK